MILNELPWWAKGLAAAAVLILFIYFVIFIVNAFKGQSKDPMYESNIDIGSSEEEKIVKIKVVKKDGKYTLQIDETDIGFEEQTPSKIDDIPVDFITTPTEELQKIEIGSTTIEFNTKTGAIGTRTVETSETSNGTLTINDSDIEYSVRNKVLYLDDNEIDFDEQTPSKIEIGDEEINITYQEDNQIKLGNEIVLIFNETSGRVNIKTGENTSYIVSPMYNGDVFKYNPNNGNMEINDIPQPKSMPDVNKPNEIIMKTTKNIWKFNRLNEDVITITNEPEGDIYLRLHIPSKNYFEVTRRVGDECDYIEAVAETGFSRIGAPTDFDSFLSSTDTFHIINDGGQLKCAVNECKNGYTKNGYKCYGVGDTSETVNTTVMIQSQNYNGDVISSNRNKFYINDSELDFFIGDPQDISLTTNGWTFTRESDEGRIMITNGDVVIYYDISTHTFIEDLE